MIASLIGAEVRRREDPALIQGPYVDDLVLPRMTFMALLRSPHVHARVLGVDTSRRRRSRACCA